MNRITNKLGHGLYFVLIIIVFLYQKENIWLIPFLFILPSIWSTADYILTQRKIKKGYWVGLGKKSIYYGNLIVAILAGGIFILIGLLIDGNKSEAWMGVDFKVYFGVFIIISSFVNIWSYPILIREGFIEIKILDVSTKNINLNRITEYNNEKDRLIFYTIKNKIEIYKNHIPINESELESFILHLEDLIDLKQSKRKIV